MRIEPAGYLGAMATPTDGRDTIEFLLGRGLERIDVTTAAASAATIIG